MISKSFLRAGLSALLLTSVLSAPSRIEARTAQQAPPAKTDRTGK